MCLINCITVSLNFLIINSKSSLNSFYFSLFLVLFHIFILLTDTKHFQSNVTNFTIKFHQNDTEQDDLQQNNNNQNVMKQNDKQDNNFWVDKQKKTLEML
jgi:hypothetical protein